MLWCNSAIQSGLTQGYSSSARAMHVSATQFPCYSSMYSYLPFFGCISIFVFYISVIASAQSFSNSLQCKWTVSQVVALLLVVLFLLTEDSSAAYQSTVSQAQCSANYSGGGGYQQRGCNADSHHWEQSLSASHPFYSLSSTTIMSVSDAMTIRLLFIFAKGSVEEMEQTPGTGPCCVWASSPFLPICSLSWLSSQLIQAANVITTKRVYGAGQMSSVTLMVDFNCGSKKALRLSGIDSNGPLGMYTFSPTTPSYRLVKSQNNDMVTTR